MLRPWEFLAGQQIKLVRSKHPPVPAFAAQFWITAGELRMIASPVHAELPHDPVSLSPNVFTETSSPRPLMHAGPLSTLMVQQNCQFTAPVQ